MSSNISWNNSIPIVDLESEPTSISDPNVIDIDKTRNMFISGEFTSSNEYENVSVKVMFFNSMQDTFSYSGITLNLSEDSNLEIVNSYGLPLGFVVDSEDNVSGFSLLVGTQ